MAGNNVSAQFVADLQSALKIDALAFAARMKRQSSAASASSQASTSNQRSFDPGFRQFANCQANAGAGNRRADCNRARIVGRVDAQPHSLRQLGRRGDLRLHR
jgi:hypothetical protein